RRWSTPVSSGSLTSGKTSPGPRSLSIVASSLRADARDVRPDPVHARERGDVERPAVRVAEGEVVRGFRQPERAEVTAVGREHPDAAGAADVEVSVDVDLHPVDRVLTRSAGHVEEELARARVGVVAHDDRALEVPVADVQP